MHWIGLLVVLCFVAHTRADPDLWGHVLFGRDIVHAGAVHASDPYSFTSDIRWVNHEWLAEAAMWLSYSAGGSSGLVVLKLLLVSLAGAFILRAWKPFGLPVKWRDALLFATALGAWPQIATFRPQVFSIAMFAALLYLLKRIHIGTGAPALLLLPLMFAVWVNLHGGWLVGAGVLAVFVATAMFDRSFVVNRGALLAAALAAAAVTLINPYGPAMLGFLGETVRPARSDIVEWRPMSDLPWIAVAFWSIPAAVAAMAVVRNGRSIPVPWLIITLVLGAGSFRVARLVGFFAVAVGLFVAPYVRSVPAESAVRNERSHGWRGQLTVYAAMLLAAVLLFGRGIPANAPTLPEPEAVQFVRRNTMSGRMLTWFDYGQYAIWHLSPAIRVSMDGRRETVYSDAMRDLHQRIYGNAPDALQGVARLDPDSIWLPADLPVIETLQQAGWRVVFRGTRSTILSRDSRLTPEHTTPPVLPRWFPGP